MIKNYFTIAFRNLRKHFGFSFINILGLTVSMTACFLIFLYVRFEWSYDGFLSKADRLYRLDCDLRTPTDLLKAEGPGWAIPTNIRNEFPEVESAVRLYTTSLLVRREGMSNSRKKILFSRIRLFSTLLVSN